MKAYFRILAFGRGFHRKVAFAFGFLTLYNALNAISLALVIPFLDILFKEPDPNAAITAVNWEAGNWKDNLYLWLEKMMLAEGKYNVLAGFCGVLLGAIVLKSIFRYCSTYLLAAMEQGIIQNLRNALFNKLTQLSVGFYTHKRKGHIVNTSVNDVQIVQEAVVGTVMNVFSDPLTVLAFFAMMLVVSWKLTLFTLLVLPATGFFINRISKKLKRRAYDGQNRFDELLAIFDEFLSGIRVVKAFRAEAAERQKYERVNAEFTDIMVRFRRREGLASPVTEVMFIIVLVIIILYGASQILDNQSDLTPSEFIGFIALFSQFLAPIKTLASAITRIQKALVSFRRIEELLSTPELATETPGGKPLPAFKQVIEVRNLSFGYDDHTVLRNLSLKVQKGETIALVGPSGSGKTTLVDLICRFYDPDEGAVLVDGVDLRACEPGSIRAQMGIVTQEPILFNDTIANNIAYGRAGATLPELENAARVANALEFIEQLPEGFNTLVGERGGRLSGGQRQRIAIARAVLKNPPILVLDEATSSLDTESERLVQQALQNLMAGRTCIIIAHRLSTITHADQILVFAKGGTIVERGTHAQLLAKNGAYKALVERQLAV